MSYVACRRCVPNVYLFGIALCTIRYDMREFNNTIILSGFVLNRGFSLKRVMSILYSLLTVSGKVSL